jgi:hypothetical protein
VTAIVALDERRVVTATYHEKNMVVRDVTRKAPLGKLAGAGQVLVLLVDDRGRVVSTGRGALERFDVSTGKREVLSQMDPYTLWAELLPDGALLQMTTAFLELTSVAANAKLERQIELDGSHFWRLDRRRVIVAGATARGQLTLALVDLHTGKIKGQAEWPIVEGGLAGTVVDGQLVLALDDGSIARVARTTLRPESALPRAVKRLAGPAVRTSDGRAWIVARWADRAVLDIRDAATLTLRTTVVIPGAQGGITAITATSGGRVVVGDNTGRVVSIAERALGL